MAYEYNPDDSPAHWHPQRQQQRLVVVQEKAYPFAYSAGPIEGDSDRVPLRRYEIEQARPRQRVQYALAPQARLQLADGTVLNGGDEITVEQLRGGADLADAQRWMQDLISAKPWPVVLEISLEAVAQRNPTVGRDRYRIGAKAIIGSSRILVPGEFVSAADFAKAAVEGKPEEPAKLNWDGRFAKAGTPAVLPQAAVDGDAMVASCVASGRVIDTWADRAKKKT